MRSSDIKKSYLGGQPQKFNSHISQTEKRLKNLALKSVPQQESKEFQTGGKNILNGKIEPEFN